MWQEELQFASSPKKRFVADLMHQVEQRAAQAKEDGLLESGRFCVAETLEGLDSGQYAVAWSGEAATPLTSGRLGEWPWGADLTHLARWGEQAAEIVAWFHERGRVLQGPTANCLAIREAFGVGPAAAPASAGRAGGGGVGGPDLILTDPAADAFLGPFRRGHADLRHFTPPEVLKGKPWNVAGDVFALGVSLFYLFTGHFPFADAEGIEQVAENIVERPPASPRAFNQDVSAALERLLGRLLAKDPGARPPADEVARELARMRTEGLLAANEAERHAATRAVLQEKRRQRVTRVRRRVKWYWTGVAVAVVAVGVIFWLSRAPEYVPAIKPDTTPEQVVRIYYQAMENLDTRRMEEAITSKAGKETIDWVSQLYVIQRMNDAMRLQGAPGGAPTPSSQPSAPSPSPTRILLLNDLQIIRVGTGDGGVFFQATYRLVLNRGDRPVEQGRTDHLRLERVERKWRIVELKQEVYNEQGGDGGKTGDAAPSASGSGK